METATYLGLYHYCKPPLDFLTNFIKVRMESCFQGRSRNAQGLGGRDVTDAIRANPDSNKRLPNHQQNIHADRQKLSLQYFALARKCRLTFC